MPPQVILKTSVYNLLEHAGSTLAPVHNLAGVHLGELCLAKVGVNQFHSIILISANATGGSNCANPCSSGDRCTSIGYPGNVCVQTPGSCGKYSCTCAAAGFAVSKDSQSCSSIFHLQVVNHCL